MGAFEFMPRIGLFVVHALCTRVWWISEIFATTSARPQSGFMIECPLERGKMERKRKRRETTGAGAGGGGGGRVTRSLDSTPIKRYG
ncbi:hypothetical protein M0802_010339 [Mischocyttarus mexicanus]|nr:hypothetical protein M0802_010339 [Mischocyttarus mexicanus]